MSNYKQSSVEWLIEELRGYDDKGDFVFNGVITSELIEQAKAMHKEEMIDAVNFGQNNHTVMVSQDLIIAEKYHNETFGVK